MSCSRLLSNCSEVMRLGPLLWRFCGSCRNYTTIFSCHGAALHGCVARGPPSKPGFDQKHRDSRQNKYAPEFLTIFQLGILQASLARAFARGWLDLARNRHPETLELVSRHR